MSWRSGAGGAALAALFLLVLAACGNKPERVLLVSIDTLRADHVGSYGATHGATPSMDSIADAGVRFEEVISPAPLTLPSHATLLTGMDPTHHGVHDNGTFRLSDDVPLLQEALREAGLQTAAVIGAVVLDRQYGLARGFDHYDDQIGLGLATGEFSLAERRAVKVVSAALDWVRTTDGRFFLWVHLYDPHAEYDPPLAQRRSFRDPYVAEIAYADAQLGRLLGEIQRRWPDGRTLVVVTSDHGESLGEHLEATHSYTIYDATQRIPLLMAGPGLPSGTLVRGPVRLSDVAPTILGLMGRTAPATLDGRDLRPLVGADSEEARPAYLEALAPRFDLGWSAVYGLRTARFKYVRAPRPELYDLERDPGEQYNLATLRVDLVHQLDATLQGYFEDARPVRPDVEVDDAQKERLETLGYVVREGRAEVELGEVGGIDPKDGLKTLPSWTQALALVDAGRFGDALEALSQIEGGGPRLALTRADIALRAGRPELAERLVREALEMADREPPEARVTLAEAWAAQGRWDEAEELLRDAAIRDPAGGYPVMVLGQIAENRGHLRRAERLYRQASERRAASSEAVWRLAALQIEAGRLEDADALLSQLDPGAIWSAEAAARLIRAERRGDLAERAERRLREALRRKPQAPALLALQESPSGF